MSVCSRLLLPNDKDVFKEVAGTCRAVTLDSLSLLCSFPVFKITHELAGYQTSKRTYTDQSGRTKLWKQYH